MTSAIITNSEIGSAMYPNNYGSAAQVNYDFQKTGKARKHDNVPFDKGSDIPEIKASLKSSAFTLVAASLINGETMTEQWIDYRKRVHSELFVYITKTGVAFEMNIIEFEEFVFTWCGMERESAKNGGGLKIRCKKESKKMIRWLEERAA